VPLAPLLDAEVSQLDGYRSIRAALLRYAQGRNDPMGPYSAKEYFVSMDRYCGFVYHVLIADLLDSPRLRRVTRGEQG